MPAAISIRNLSKRYGAQIAADDVSFDVQPGEIFGLLGPNGAGKTTVLECALGLRQPDAGAVEICGIDALRHPAQIKHHIGAQLQATALPDKITPREAIRLFASFYPKHSATEEALDRFSLREKAGAPFDTLSSGQRQRLALALAFVNEPQVVFLDEPTAGLDAQSRADSHVLIQHLRAQGRAIVLTTHYIAEAEMLCDRLAIIDRGKIVATGTAAELITRAGALPRISLRTARPLTEPWLIAQPGVRHVSIAAPGCQITTTSVTHTLTAIIPALAADANELLDLQVHQPSLEAAFIQLTAKAPA